MTRCDRVLVTGSSGLIGTNLALRLIDEGAQVIGIDRRENEWTDKIDRIDLDLRPRDGSIAVESIEQGLADRNIAPGDIDVVVHLAAVARVYASVCDPRASIDNLATTHAMLELCRPHRTPFIFASSREVYGNRSGANGPVSEEKVDHRRAASPYAAGKIAAEAYVASYAGCFDLPTTVLRFSNVYGRYDSDVERTERVIPLFIDRLRQGLPITVYGSEKLLDFTYIDDTVEGIIRTMTMLADESRRKPVAGRTLNIGSGQGRSLVDLARLIAERVGVAPEIVLDQSRPGEVCRYVADLSSARELLGYVPRFTLETGLDSSFAWRDAWQADHAATPAESA